LFDYSGNNYALTCCNCIAEEHAPFNALYIYGPHASGKTAILENVESRIYQINPNRQVFRGIDAVENIDFGHHSFKNTNDVFLIDNIDSIFRNGLYNQIQTLSELLKKLSLTKNKIVMTGDQAIKELCTRYKGNLSTDDFFHRMSWEMSIGIASPTYDECRNILLQALKQRDIPQMKEPDKIISLLLETNGNNLGLLLGTLNRILVRSNYQKQLITLEFAENIIYENTSIELLD